GQGSLPGPRLLVTAASRGRSRAHKQISHAGGRPGSLLHGPRDFRGTSTPFEAPASMENPASELRIHLWAQEDLNLRPLPCQGMKGSGGDLPKWAFAQVRAGM